MEVLRSRVLRGILTYIINIKKKKLIVIIFVPIYIIADIENFFGSWSIHHTNGK